MFILTDGVNYVAENPMKTDEYISTTSSVQAKEFTYKKARSLIQSKKKSLAWIKRFHMMNLENGKIDNSFQYRQGNGGAYIGEKDIEFDESIMGLIYDEANSIMSLAAWDMKRLTVYEELLRQGLSKYDSADSDIEHALQKYKEDNDGKKPQAHKMAKIGYLLDEVRDKRKHIKRCLKYIDVMKNAIKNNYSVEKIKSELEKSMQGKYKGRTDYYRMALDMLG